MVTRALARYVRIAPRKLRIVIAVIKKKNVGEALAILASANKKGASILKCVIESALANAKRIPEKKYTAENLYISKIACDGGPALKRFRAMSMGRAGVVRKRTSHVLVELDVLKGAIDTKKVAKKEGVTRVPKEVGKK
ncbi:MAG: 50S ribosomal protein L22 [Candidatus Omnitrophota bacterium]